MTDAVENTVTVTESGLGPYAQFATVGRPLTSEQKSKLLEVADKCPVSQTLQRPSVVESRFA